MSRLGIFGTAVLSLALASAVPAIAGARGGGGGWGGGGGGGGGAHAGGGMGGGAAHFSGGMGGGRAGPTVGGAPNAFAGGMQSSRGAFQGTQANVATGTSNTFRGSSFNNGNFSGRSGQFAQQGTFRGDRGRGEFRGDRGRRFGPGVGFAAGLAAGSALGWGGYGYGYDPYYYGDDYAYGYDDYPGAYGAYASSEYVAPGGDASGYCAQRYRSYDPASGTYLGYDGLRHPCP
jgi:hypothetical protein